MAEEKALVPRTAGQQQQTHVWHRVKEWIASHIIDGRPVLLLVDFTLKCSFFFQRYLEHFRHNHSHNLFICDIATENIYLGGV